MQFSLAVTTAALLSEMRQNRRFLTVMGHFECKFKVDGDVGHNPSVDR